MVRLLAKSIANVSAVVAIALFYLLSDAAAQTPSPSAKAEMAPTGRLRVAFPVNALTAPKNATTGELGGLTADLGRELARLVGVPYEPVEFDGPGKFIDV